MLFAMSSHDLHGLMGRLGLSMEEEEKLVTALRLLAACYSEPLHHYYIINTIIKLTTVTMVTNQIIN